MSNSDQIKDVGVFFDFENIVYSLRRAYGINPNFEDLMDKCKEFGRVVVARAYTDWSGHRTMTVPLHSSGFELVYVPIYGTNINYQNHSSGPPKNIADMYMVIDVMEVLNSQPNIDTYVLLTGDKDFIPLAQAIRRRGKRVIGLGVDGASSPHFAQTTDLFILYSEVSGLPQAPSASRPSDIYEALVQAVGRLIKEDKSTVLPSVKLEMGQLLGGFDEKKFNDDDGVPFARFKDFVLEAQRKELVTLITEGTVNTVLLTEKTAQAADRSIATAPRSEEPLTVNRAFSLLSQAVRKAQDEGRSPRVASIKSILNELSHNFDHAQIIGRSFEKFSDLVRAAEKQNLVRVNGVGNQMEIYPPRSTDEHGEVPSPNYMQYRAVSDREARQLVLDGLRAFDNYPSPFIPLESFCRELRDERSIYLPNWKLRELLTEANHTDLLVTTSPLGAVPKTYELTPNADIIANFLNKQGFGDTNGNLLPGTAELHDLPISENGDHSSLEEAIALLKQAVTQAHEGSYSLRPADISKRMKRIAPDFNVTTVSANNGATLRSFTELVAIAAERGDIVISGTESEMELRLAA